MNVLLKSGSQKAVEAFGRSHGDMRTWSDVDFEVHQNFAAIAALAARPGGGMVRTAGRRTTAVVVFAYATALYAVVEVLCAWRGIFSPRLEDHLHAVVTGPLTRSEMALRRSGDVAFRLRVERVGRRVNGAVDRLTARLVRG